jgi:hypothetical protein
MSELLDLSDEQNQAEQSNHTYKQAVHNQRKLISHCSLRLSSVFAKRLMNELRSGQFS